MTIDRNPHPDAKEAFDYVQEAYEELISHSNRRIYDRSIQKKKGITWKKIQKLISNEMINLKARWALFVHRISLNKESRQEEYQELIGNKLVDISNNLHQFSEKVVLVPSMEDRISLVNEVFSDHFSKIISMSFLVRLFLLPFI